MKRTSIQFVAGVVYFLLALMPTWGQSMSAWEDLIQNNPAAADNPQIGWQERLILHALTPQQAEAYFRRGADPQNLILGDGRTLREYLDSKVSPPVSGFVSLPTPCRLFAAQEIEAHTSYSLRVRGGDRSAETDPAPGCLIPGEASALVLQVRLDSQGESARFKVWAADGPEPAEGVLETDGLARGPALSTVVSPLSDTRDLGADLLMKSSASSSVQVEAVGYFRELSTGEGQGGRILFSVESASTNSFGTGAGTLGADNSYFGAYAGTVATGDKNSFFGGWAGFQNTTGNTNAFFGFASGYGNTSGYHNSVFGAYAGFNNSTGDDNVFLGWSSGGSNTVGNSNTYLGSFSDAGATVSNATAVGHQALVSQSNSLVLGSIAGLNDAVSSVNVGIGTPAPSVPLHVARSDGTAMVLVEETTPTVANRVLFRLTNNGAPWFKLLNTNTSQEWTFAMDQFDNFIFSRIGTGGAEFKIYQSGQVTMGPGGSEVFSLLPNGDLVIAGGLTANGVFYASDRNLKENFTPVDSREVLERLANLEITRWNYREDEARTPHLGPVAQDFHTAFGLGGDEEHINAMDISGVALSAIQGLSQRLSEKDAEMGAARVELAQQKAEIEELRSRLKEMEGLQVQLREIRQLLNTLGPHRLGD